MPTTTLSTLTTDQIDDLLYLARHGETTDLTTAIDLLAKSPSTNPNTILTAAVDPDSGNGLLHMAAANGHTATIKYLLALSSSTTHAHALNLNIQNTSGNTPLHWAALNGHMSAVQLLLGAGADPTVRNKAGKDAVFEAEAAGKDEVVEWLLKEGKGLESAVGGGSGGAAGGVGEEAGAEGQLEEVMGEAMEGEGQMEEEMEEKP